MADATRDNLTRPSLLVRIRDARDAAAWSEFLEIYAPLVYRYAIRRGLQDSDAADVTQDVLAQVARSARGFEYRPERGRFRDWLGTITRSKIANHYRTTRRDPRAIGGDQNGAAEAVAADPDWTVAFDARVFRAALDRARPHFEPATWRSFELVWLEDRPASEVARTLALPIDAVYVAKSRVLKRLRAEVEALAEDLPVSIPLA